MTQNQTDVPEIPGLKALNRLLAMALWHPKQDSAGNAYSAIKTATKAVVKSGIIEAQFEVWKRGSVSAIKEFFPQFVELGCKFQYVLKSDPVDWAVERIWESLRGQGGVNKLGELGNHELDNVRWWLAIATQLKLEVNQKDAKSWRVPRWLTQSRSLAATERLFQKFLDRLSLTFYNVLDVEKERARVSVALTGNSSTVFQPEKVPATAIGNPCSKRKPKKLAPLERKRRSVIFGAIQSNLVGRQYCIELDQKRLPISLRWAAEGCPDTYAVAYMDSSGIWQKRIQDEKYRYKMKYKQTSPYRNHSRGASGVLRALLKMRALRCHGYCPEWVFRVVLAIRVVQATQECCGPCGSFAQQRCCGQSVLQAGPSKAGRNQI